MPPDRDTATVLDMAGAARLIADFVKGMDFEAFRADARTQSAVIPQLLVIGEAARRDVPALLEALKPLPPESGT